MASPLALLIVLAVIAGLVLFLSAPLRGPERAPESASEVADLEAARVAKYRELRDADLDHRTGKLSDQDYAELDTVLRGEAIEILRELDRSNEALPSPPA